LLIIQKWISDDVRDEDVYEINDIFRHVDKAGDENAYNRDLNYDKF
jgi:hypothetical protein